MWLRLRLLLFMRLTAERENLIRCYGWSLPYIIWSTLAEKIMNDNISETSCHMVHLLRISGSFENHSLQTKPQTLKMKSSLWKKRR